MAKSQSDSSRVRQDQPESIIGSTTHAFLRKCKAQANVRSNYSVRSPLLYAHLEVVRFTAIGLRPSLNADAAKLCANCPELQVWI